MLSLSAGKLTDGGMLNLRALPRLQTVNLAGVDLSTRQLADLPKKPPRLDVIDVVAAAAADSQPPADGTLEAHAHGPALDVLLPWWRIARG